MGSEDDWRGRTCSPLQTERGLGEGQPPVTPAAGPPRLGLGSRHGSSLPAPPPTTSWVCVWGGTWPRVSGRRGLPRRQQERPRNHGVTRWAKRGEKREQVFLLFFRRMNYQAFVWVLTERPLPCWRCDTLVFPSGQQWAPGQVPQAGSE